MDSQFSDIRKEYKKGKLTRNTISENPFEQFARWLNDALHCGENEPTAMIVATVSPDGRPSTRTVLLKGVENGKLIFFTNYESRKGRQLTANPYISLSFVWHKLERQVHIEGKAEKCTPQESDAYFTHEHEVHRRTSACFTLHTRASFLYRPKRQNTYHRPWTYCLWQELYPRQ